MRGMQRKARSQPISALATARMLRALLRRARAQPALLKRAPGGKRWEAGVQVVGEPAMKKLNTRYRRIRRSTDVLSFEAPKIFRAQGWLGELVICSPVLRRQARELGHSPSVELEILLVHGVLHLLGFDHERGAAHARAMRKWEAKLLGARARNRGLLVRTH